MIWAKHNGVTSIIKGKSRTQSGYSLPYRTLSQCYGFILATVLKDRDDIYLSSSEDEEEPKGKKKGGRDIDDDDDLVYDGDEGSDSDEREVLKSDSGDEDSEDEYAKALAMETAFANKKNQGKKSTLLTDLDPADEEIKKKRKIESWCKSAELKVGLATLLNFILVACGFTYLF